MTRRPHRARGVNREPARVSAPEESALVARMSALLESDRAWLTVEHPLIADLAAPMTLVPVFDERVPTAMTDGRFIFYNPYFMADRSGHDRLFVLAHEVWHGALDHLRRGVGRACSRRWNLACDHEVNVLLSLHGLTAPRDAVLLPEWEDEGAEPVYARLSPLSPPMLQAVLRQQGVLSGAGDAAPPPWADAVAGRRDPRVDPWFGATLPPLPPGHSQALREALARAQGRGMEGLARRVEALLDPPRARVNWRETLASHLTRRQPAPGRGWHRVQTRHLWRGLYLPAPRMQPQGRVAVAVDVSGSTWQARGRMLREVLELIRQVRPERVHLLACAHAITLEREVALDAGEEVALDSLGWGGGTDFHPVFERLVSQPPDVLIFLTDGDGPAPVEAPPWPVIWALDGGGTPPAAWGEALTLEG
jgi:predicted metal-dependent peptidase